MKFANSNGGSHLQFFVFKATAASKLLKANTIVFSVAMSERQIRDLKWIDYTDYGGNFCYGRKYLY